MRYILVLLFVMQSVQQTLAQRYPFQWVNVPDSISDIPKIRKQSQWQSQLQ